MGTGDQVAIGGFIVTGNAQKKVIVRGLGPSLQQANIDSFLADPVLELHNPNGSVLTTNDNWKDTQEAAILATGVAPTDDHESAIIALLAPNPYTAVLRGKNNTSGTGLIEIYDLDPAADSQLANISTRGFVQTQENVMIGGFMLGGNTNSSHVIVRGIGPSLAAAGVTNVLADPTIDLRDNNGDRITFNDNWQDDAAEAAAVSAAGVPPGNAAESALSVTLPPGTYTVILSGKAGASGNALLEVYKLP